jgi:uncharacterized membrane protein YjjP (DUF1212 family)
VATGQPVSDIEDELTEVSSRLGYPDLQVAAGPTGVTLSLSSGEPATYEAAKGSLRLDQAADVRTIRYRLLQGLMSVDDAISELLQLAAKPPRYPRWLANVGWVGIATGIGLILQPGWANVAFAALGSVIVLVLLRLGERFPLVATLLPTLAAFVLACLVFGASDAGLLQGPLRTLLPPLAVLLPGALIVTAMSELAAGDMMAGSARLIFGGVQILLFTLGIVAAARLLAVPAGELGNVRVSEIGWWAAPVGLVMLSLGVGLLESPSLRLLPWIFGVLVIAFAAQTLGQQVASTTVGSFLGATAASLGSYLVEAIRPELPRLVVFLPAFWLLVPGSLGVLTATALVIDTDRALQTAINVFAVISAITLGLLVGSAVAHAVGRVLLRARRVRLRAAGRPL